MGSNLSEARPSVSVTMLSIDEKTGDGQWQVSD
jgi:hypothetical protein